MAYSGDTVRLKVNFKTFGGDLVNPTGISLTLYDGLVILQTIPITAADNETIGVYFYDYVIPDDIPELIFEFKGLHNNKPILARDTVQVQFTK